MSFETMARAQQQRDAQRVMALVIDSLAGRLRVPLKPWKVPEAEPYRAKKLVDIITSRQWRAGKIRA